jgi:antitoxin component of MazEF toxin-antitoxin module
MKEYEDDKQNRVKEIVRTWITGNCSATLVIPREFAKEYGLDQPSHVIVEKKSDGLLIRKLEV